MLENVNSVPWDTLHYAYSPCKVPDILYAMDSAQTNDDFIKNYDILRECVNHQDSIYDSTIYVVPFIVEMLKQSNDPVRIIEHLNFLGGLLWHIPNDEYPRFSFPWASVWFWGENNYLLAIYKPIKANINQYLKLLSHENEVVRVGSIHILSYLRDEYIQILPALQDCIELSKSVWTRAGGCWAYATVASYELVTISDSETRTLQVSKHLQALETWTQSDQIIMSSSAAIGYIAVMASDRAQANASTPKHIIELVIQALIIKPWGKFDPPQEKSEYPDTHEILPFISARELVIRWCQQSPNPNRWEAVITHPQLSSIEAHDFVRLMLDKYFHRLSIHTSYSPWHNHPFLDPTQINDSIIYRFFDRKSRYKSAQSLKDTQRQVLKIVCSCDKFWELPTNLFSFYYGLPDDREALSEFSG